MDMESPRRGQGLERQGADGAQLPQQGRKASDPCRGAGGSRGATVPPPMPAYDPAPGGVTGLADWLRAPRPEAAPGIWRHDHRPLPPRGPDPTPTPQLMGGALVAFLVGWLIWSLLYNGYLGDYWIWPLLALTPESWRSAGDDQIFYVWCTYLYYGLVIAGLVGVFGRLGRWPELVRRATAPFRRSTPTSPQAAPAPPAAAPRADPVEWPELRERGAASAADRLAGEVRSGRMNDVDHARVRRAWESVQARPARLTAFLESVRSEGAAAFCHPSGQRDLPHLRTARHDLSLDQVRIGTAPDHDRNPDPYRGAGLALEPALLGTSALAVGPPGSGKTRWLVRPVIESLCLQALAQQATVVAVTAHGERLAPDEQFDVVLRPGNPASEYDLDPYGGADDPDEAAAMLAEALVGDLAEDFPGGDSSRAATVLAQLIGPYRAVHGRFPSVPELRELLDATPGGGAAAGPLGALRTRLETDGHGAQLRELNAYIRQASHGGVSGLLADRVAMLDRPAFEGFLVPEGSAADTGAEGAAASRRPFSLRALEKPVRVRVDLPERGHAEASRILARLVLAQFTACVTAREGRSLFAGLVLDDASRTVTPQSLRGLQQLRSANGGVLLTLRGLDDVPERLQAPLLGAVGCRMVCAGVTPWDAERFAEVWGTEWVETRDVTNRQLVSDEPFTKVMHAVRRLATGRHVTAESVTVRQVQRQRWSASELANELPAGHAVLSLSTVAGERTPPILARLEA